MTRDEQARFTEAVWRHYRDHGRHDLPWRQPADGGFDPYRIMVSEVMLQQTQVSRVIPKYHQFLKLFPTVEALAAAELGDVLRAWSGLGYNRRAKFLHRAAQAVSRSDDGFPRSAEALTSLPGIGANTAGAILAYAYNQPAVFVETNIRTVFIHHFFNDRAGLTDREILVLVNETLDAEHPREWYWALMDYGTFLKREIGNLNMLSNAYNKQSVFEGSRRQIRGRVLRELGSRPLTRAALGAAISDARLDSVIADLLQEGLIARQGPLLTI